MLEVRHFVAPLGEFVLGPYGPRMQFRVAQFELELVIATIGWWMVVRPAEDRDCRDGSAAAAPSPWRFLGTG